MLAKGGRFDVTHIADPTAALALAATQPWDLVITDLDLPLMSGFEFAAVLRQMAPRLPVVIVTAYPQDAPILTSIGPRRSAGRPAGQADHGRPPAHHGHRADRVASKIKIIISNGPWLRLPPLRSR